MAKSPWIGRAGLAAGAGWFVAACLMTPQSAPARDPVHFGRDILPILSDKCFKCHGPDPSSRMADLRLDTPQGAFAARNGKWPIVPGDPENSLILKRIHDPENPMPPEGSGKSLTDREKSLLRQWILEGAKYTKLWSFEPLPKRVPVPQTGEGWARDDLDRFVFARMRQEGLSPSPPASPERWLRRVTLDLTGLPPTEAEIADYLRTGDREGVVDRLLASARFGERWATDWLDVARYADSYGYQSDLLMPTWPYRDWVVRALNANMPYDRFLTEQLAGDLLPNATRDQVLATAFNRLHRQSNEGGSIAEEFKTEYAVDRTATFGTAVLGLTLACARCHDHKFDPITQREFFQFYAYFNSIEEYGLLLSTEIVPTPSLLLPTPEQETTLATLKQARNAARERLARAKAAARTAEPKAPSGPALTLDFENLKEGKFASGVSGDAHGAALSGLGTAPGRRGASAVFDGDNGVAVKGLPAKDRWEPFSWSFWLSDPGQKGPVVLLHRTGGTDVGFCGSDLMLEDGFVTARVMRHWPGNAVAVRSASRIPKEQWSHLAWTWDGSGSAKGLRLYLNGKPMHTQTLADDLWKRTAAYGDHGPSGGDWCFGQRFRDAGFKGGKVDDVAFFAREIGPTEVRALFDGRPADPGDAWTHGGEPSVAQARQALLDAEKRLAEFEEQIREISVMREAKPPIPAHLLARGQYDAPKSRATLVRRGVPAVLPPLKAARNDRLALARWATSADHPLTARVAVNRFWQAMFGTGLVETSENFGVQGAAPSHPELLDFLARRFVEEGWDVKKTLRRIALSATYAQDSARRNNLDPANRWLARGPSQRLSGEMMRDVALAASGLLVEKVGGPPVNPYQPAGLWQENNAFSPPFVQSKGEGLYRRSLYSTWKRTTPVPTMMLFDATSREACVTRRPSTSTPLQALALLNDVQFVEAARVLAERALAARADTPSRLQFAFLKLAGRNPTSGELAILEDLVADQRARYQADPDAAAKLVAVGEAKSAVVEPTELAALTVGVQAILNSDAVVWKR